MLVLTPKLPPKKDQRPEHLTQTNAWGPEMGFQGGRFDSENAPHKTSKIRYLYDKKINSASVSVYSQLVVGDVPQRYCSHPRVQRYISISIGCKCPYFFRLIRWLQYIHLWWLAMLVASSCLVKHIVFLLPCFQRPEHCYDWRLTLLKPS